MSFERKNIQIYVCTVRDTEKDNYCSVDGTATSNCQLSVAGSFTALFDNYDNKEKFIEALKVVVESSKNLLLIDIRCDSPTYKNLPNFIGDQCIHEILHYKSTNGSRMCIMLLKRAEILNLK